MPIFQFHVRDAYGLVVDDDGVDLPDLAAVLEEAIVSSGEFLAEASAPTDMLFEITDESDRVVLVLPIRPYPPAVARAGAGPPRRERLRPGAAEPC